MTRDMFRVAAMLMCFTASVQGQEKPVWLAVGRPGLVEGLGPLVERRRADGFEPVVSTEPVDKAIAALGRRPACILLVGDDGPAGPGQSWRLDAKRVKLYRWRAAQPREFDSDAAWGDLDGDSVPDVPVGRIPARTREQVEIVVAKTIAWEDAPVSLNDLGLLLWAGSAQYGPAADALVATLLMPMVRQNVPKWAVPWIICGHPGHVLCGWPPDQPRLFTEQFRRGGAMAVFMGHAGTLSFESVAHDGRVVTYSADDAREVLSRGSSGPPMVLFACWAGKFTEPAPCMGESFLFMPAGPVAVVAATTESHPLTNFYGGVSLLRRLDGSNARLGELWLSSQIAAMKQRNPLIDRLLLNAEGNLGEELDASKLRQEHLLMYAILGDPATRMRLPGPLNATVERKDGRWHWKVERPKGTDTLRVGYRADGPAAPRAPQAAKAPETQELFNRSNAAFEFTPLAAPAAVEWTGAFDKDGWLRFVASGPGKLHVATVRLASPTESAGQEP